MFFAVVSFSTLVALDGIRNYLTGNFYQQGRIYGSDSAITANPNDLALTLNLALPLALALLQINQNKFKRLFFFSYLILATFAIFCTFSRGGFIVLVVIILLHLVKFFKTVGPKILVPAILFLILCGFLLPEGYTDRLEMIFDHSRDPTGSAVARKVHTFDAIEIILKHPLLGMGLNMHNLGLHDMSGSWGVVHNVYLQIGADLGIPAMVAFMILLFKLIRKMQFIQKDPNIVAQSSEIAPLAQGIEISLIAFAVASLFHPVAYHFYFYYLAGYAVSLNRITSSDDA
jgi:O-antigen ligase